MCRDSCSIHVCTVLKLNILIMNGFEQVSFQMNHSQLLNYSLQSVLCFIHRSMAKWLKDYLNFGSRRDPPQPPRPDYSESEILRAYRAQKELDFEDPYQHSDKEHKNGGFSPCNATVSLPSFPAFGSVLPNGVEVWRVFTVKTPYITT